MALAQNSKETENHTLAIHKRAAVDLLAYYQISVTPDRVRILEAFFQSPVTLTIAQIRQNAQLACNKTTIYRTIDTFLQNGVIHRIADCEGVIRYGITPLVSASGYCWQSVTDIRKQKFIEPVHKLPRGEHVHFKCDQCQTVTCLFELSINLPSMLEGYTIQKTDILVVGLCARCTARQAKN